MSAHTSTNRLRLLLMAANLQQDIAACFDHIAEPLDSVAKCLEASSEPADALDSRLRTQLAHLEQLRDHVKQWHVGADVREKITASSEPRSSDMDILKLLKKPPKKQHAKLLSRRVFSELAPPLLSAFDEPEQEPRTAPPQQPSRVRILVASGGTLARHQSSSPLPVLASSILRPAAPPAKPALKWAAAAAAGSNMGTPTLPPVLPAVPPPAPVLAPSEPAFTPAQAIPEENEPAEDTETVPAAAAAPQPPQPVAAPEVVTALETVPRLQPTALLFADPPLGLLLPNELALVLDAAMTLLPPGIQAMVAERVFVAACEQRHSSELVEGCVPYNWAYVPYRFLQLPLELPAGYHPSTDLVFYAGKWNALRGALAGAPVPPLWTPDLPDTLVALFFGYYYSLTRPEKRLAAELLAKAGWILNNNRTWFQRVGQAQAMPGFEVGNYRMFDVASWNVAERPNFKLEYDSSPELTM